MFKLIGLMLIKPINLITFCGYNYSIDGITKLSNGSLFMTRERFYWILDQNNNSYELPTDANKHNISDILPNVHRIDSVERIDNFVSDGKDSQYEQNKDLLVFYWVFQLFQTCESELRFLILCFFSLIIV